MTFVQVTGGGGGVGGTTNITINGLEPWSAKVFSSGSFVSHLGEIWYTAADTTSGDVPGTAATWVKKSGSGTPTLLEITNASTPSISANNTISAAVAAPRAGTPKMFFVNGNLVENAGITMDASGVITITSATLGYNVTTTDILKVFYYV